MSDMIKLKSNDDEVFESKVARMSDTVKSLLDDFGNEDPGAPIPLPNVNGRILKLVIEWAKHHKDDPARPDDEDNDERRAREISEWDNNFLNVDQDTLFEIILAANYMDIKPLFEVSCKFVAHMMIGKSAEEIRQKFNIQNDFTPEIQERFRKENEWVENM